MSVQSIATKYRRALRNGTGAKFTFDQLQELASLGVLELIAQIEAQELYPAKPAHISSVTSGSTSGAMAVPQVSGKSPERPRDLSYIAALTARA
jgi:hypothetical protein